MKKARSKITYANTISTVCLFMLLGGSAYAAAAITGKSIRNNSITGRDVKNKSLTKKDFRGSTRGPRGVQGPQEPSVLGQITVVESGQVAFGPSDTVQSAIAFCPGGQRAISGGGVSVSDEQLAATKATGGRSGWYVIGVDLVDNGPGDYIQAQALCAPAGQAIAAGTTRSHVRAKIARLEAEIAGGRQRR